MYNFAICLKSLHKSGYASLALTNAKRNANPTNTPRRRIHELRLGHAAGTSLCDSNAAHACALLACRCGRCCWTTGSSVADRCQLKAMLCKPWLGIKSLCCGDWCASRCCTCFERVSSSSVAPSQPLPILSHQLKDAMGVPSYGSSNQAVEKHSIRTARRICVWFARRAELSRYWGVARVGTLC